MQLSSYKEITDNIEIEVIPQFVPDQEDFPNQYLFSYLVTIRNQSKKKCQLLRRHWIITNGEGEKEIVEGDGVIGQQPVLRPGQSHQYSSFCPLPTPTGNMRGWYEFVDENQKFFKVKIPLFFLRADQFIH